MLPFTTYSFPETVKNNISQSEKWLCMLVNQGLSGNDKELLHKISSALKADFDKEVICIEHDGSDKNSIVKPDLSDVKLIISFDVSPSVLGIWIDLPASGLRILETCSVIRTVTIKSLSESATAKKVLWSAMQEYAASK